MSGMKQGEGDRTVENPNAGEMMLKVLKFQVYPSLSLGCLDRN